MIAKLKPYFLELTAREMETVWREFVRSRRHRPMKCPFRTPEQMFDSLHEQGIYHTELVSPLLGDPEYLPIVRKLTGAEV